MITGLIIKSLINPNMFYIKNVMVLFAVLLVAGCMQDELCEDITDNPLRIGFYTFEDGENTPISVDSLTVFGLEYEDFLYDNQYNVGRIEVPLNMSVDNCAFVMVFPESTDTLKVFYERNLSLVSVECGFVTFYDIFEVQTTNNSIQSYSIEENNVTNTNEEHLHIILYPAAD